MKRAPDLGKIWRTSWSLQWQRCLANVHKPQFCIAVAIFVFYVYNCICLFGLRGAVYIVILWLHRNTSFSLPFSELSLAGFALDLVD